MTRPETDGCSASHKLLILSFNARSICNKFDSFLSLVSCYKPAIVAVTETWIRPDIPGIFVEGYTCFRSDHPFGLGGGTLLLVRCSLSPVEIFVQSSIDNIFRDSTWCSLSLSRDHSLLVGCVYRSPSCETDNNLSLNHLITAACDLPQKHKVILGDFNYPDVNWDNLSGVAASEAFRDTINNCFLTQMVRRSTRGSSILDLILSTDPSIFENVEVIEPLLGSDHNAVMCTISFNAPECITSNVSSHTLDLDRADWSLYSCLLESVNWDDMFLSSDPDEMWDFLKNSILLAASKSVPLKRPSRIFCGISVSGEVKRALNARRKIYKRYRNCSPDYCAEKLRNADERLQLALHNARIFREKKIAQSLTTSPHLFWKHIHRNLGRKPNVNAVETTWGSLTTSDAEMMNRYFSSVFTAEKDGSLSLIHI